MSFSKRADSRIKTFSVVVIKPHILIGMIFVGKVQEEEAAEERPSENG